MMNEKLRPLLLVSALALSAGAVACESEKERQANERKDEAEAREELTERSKEAAPDSAAEMKKDVGIHSMEEDDKAESAQELRDDLDLHPEDKPE